MYLCKVVECLWISEEAKNAESAFCKVYKYCFMFCCSLFEECKVITLCILFSVHLVWTLLLYVEFQSSKFHITVEHNWKMCCVLSSQNFLAYYCKVFRDFLSIYCANLELFKKTVLLCVSGTDKTLVFVEQKRNADFLASFLSQTGFPTTSIHG